MEIRHNLGGYQRLSRCLLMLCVIRPIPELNSKLRPAMWILHQFELKSTGDSLSIYPQVDECRYL